MRRKAANVPDTSSYHYQNRLISLSVWELEDYDNEIWGMELEIYFKDMNLEDCLQAKNEVPAVKMVAFHPFDSEVVYLNFPDGLVACNMKTKTLKLVCVTETMS